MKKLLFPLFVILLFAACQKESISPVVPEGNQILEPRSPGDKVSVCHNGHIIQININAVPAHLAHGDAVDMDDDGYFNLQNVCGSGVDCNDNNPTIHPGATELCNGIDDNCDNQIDEGVTTTFYQDVDGDSYGNPSVTTQACTVPAGYVANNTDCNDNVAAINPGGAEICGNNIDDNCNGEIDEGCFATVAICNQVWMLKNLDVAKYRNGDPIPKVTDFDEWFNLTTGAYCYYNNDSATYAATYGKLYNWYAVNDPRGLAPEGWHVPSNDDWSGVLACAGLPYEANGALREAGTAHWFRPNNGATNSSGFTALPAGNRYLYWDFADRGWGAFFWTSYEADATLAGMIFLYSGDPFVGSTWIDKRTGMSVRCVKD